MKNEVIINSLADQHDYTTLGKFDYIYLEVIRFKGNNGYLYIRESIRTDERAKRRYEARLSAQFAQIKADNKRKAKEEELARFEDFKRNGSDLECYYDVTDRRW